MLSNETIMNMVADLRRAKQYPGFRAKVERFEKFLKESSSFSDYSAVQRVINGDADFSDYDSEVCERFIYAFCKMMISY